MANNFEDALMEALNELPASVLGEIMVTLLTDDEKEQIIDKIMDCDTFDILDMLDASDLDIELVITNDNTK